jgi:hypothetical protein
MVGAASSLTKTEGATSKCGNMVQKKGFPAELDKGLKIYREGLAYS